MYFFRQYLVASLLWILAPTVIYGQGPSSRPILTGPTITRNYGSRTVSENTVIPIPDLFRTEAPFVERNYRIDYLGSNGLQEPVGDESQFASELTYSFTDRFGVVLAAPLTTRSNLDEPDASGFGDLTAGVRYVFIGYENEDPFKLALGLNVLTPTGDVNRNLGAGQTFLEPELLMFQKLGKQAFMQSQFGLGIPTRGDNTSTDFSWNLGMGYVFTEIAVSQLFKFPTAVVELNGATGLGGSDAGMTVVDFTPGLRWSIRSRAFGGVAMSVPLSSAKEFETQLILSLIYRYGPVDEERPDPTSSRAYF